MKVLLTTVALNWFVIKFAPKQLQNDSDKNLAKEFMTLFERLNKPEGLTLFRDNHKLHNYQYYYMRIPESFPFDTLKIFSHNGTVNKTFPPAVMMLEPIEGDLSS